MELLDADDLLLDEFPLDMNDIFHAFYPIWTWATHDVAERQAFTQAVEVNEKIWASRATALLARMEKAGNNSLVGVVWSVSLVARQSLLVILLLLGACVVVSVFAVISVWLEGQNQDQLATATILVMIGGIVGVGLAILKWVRPWLDQRIWFRLNEKFAKRCYNRLWRSELLDFQRRSHIPDRFFRALFAHFADRTATSSWVNQFVQQDFAPAMLAGAQRYEA
jgi:hypothetical protein